MRPEGGLQMHHAVLFHHGADGRYHSLVNFGRICHGNDLDARSLLKLVELVLQHVKAHFQVLGVHYEKKRHTGGGGTVQGGVHTADRSADGGGDGAIREFVLQLPQGGQRGVVAAVDAGLPFDFVGRLVQFLAFVALPHQDGLVLIFGLFQFGLVAGYPVLQDILAQAHHHFPLPHTLAQLDVKAHNLLTDTAVHGHFGFCLDGSLAGEPFGLNGALQTLRRRNGLLRNRVRPGLRHRGRCAAAAGCEGKGKGYESEIPIHTASGLRSGNRWSSIWPAT